MKIKFTWDKTKEVKPYPIKIHNKQGEIVGELLPRSWRIAILDVLGIRWDYPSAIEKWAWLNSLYLAELYRIVGQVKYIEATDGSVRRLFDGSVRKLFAEMKGAACFACHNSSVRPHAFAPWVQWPVGYFCTTKGCPMNSVGIPASLLNITDEMPDYSSEPEFQQLLQMIKLIESNSKQLLTRRRNTH